MGELLPVETGRLLVRSLEPGDISALVALWTDPEVTAHLGGPRDPARVRDLLDEELRTGGDRFTMWPVIEKASGRVIGDCGLLKKEVEGRDEIELVYVFAADVWGRGYATEAAAAVRDAARIRWGLTRLIALIDPDNIASARVAEKIGMRFERQTARPGGAIRLVYSLALSRMPAEG